VEVSKQQVPATEMERMMKAQEVILKAAAGKLKWWEAAEIMGVTDRTMRRWRERLNEHGYSGLWDYRKRSPSPKRVPMKTVEEVLQLYREKYFDFNVQHFHEKLRELHGIELSYTWVKTALQTAGFVKRRKKPGSHRKRRPRRPLPGMMLHIDGSEHRWFGDERYYELIVVLDDATSEIYYAQLVESESTRSVMAALREVVETRGLFCSLYSDRAGHFFVTAKRGERVDMSRPTQVGRALQELGVKMIAAYSPQARGRSERNFGTWQGRLPQELRLREINDLALANEFLRNEYIAEFNGRFMGAAAQKAMRLCVPGARISTGSSAYSTNARFTTTIRSPWRTACSNSIRHAGEIRSPGKRSSSMSIWTVACRSAMAHTSLHSMRLTNCRRKQSNGGEHRGCPPDEWPD
jgi:transposase